jgi:hypothetical protein
MNIARHARPIFGRWRGSEAKKNGWQIAGAIVILTGVGAVAPAFVRINQELKTCHSILVPIAKVRDFLSRGANSSGSSGRRPPSPRPRR